MAFITSHTFLKRCSLPQIAAGKFFPEIFEIDSQCRGREQRNALDIVGKYERRCAKKDVVKSIASYLVAFTT